jgi:hypothetical protein
MSNCENSITIFRGSFCENCPLGKPGYVKRIVNFLENSGEVDRLAGKIWM